MTMSPRLRYLALTAHVTCSVGWVGAVVAFLGLAIIGLTSDDLEVVRGVYLTMELAGWFVLVPLAVASLVTGLVQSLGTHWGVFRHYWVVFKLAINIAAAVVLLVYMQTLAYFADVAREADDAETLRSASPLLHAAAALVLLLTATTLAVFKPRGVTPYGQRKQRARV